MKSCGYGTFNETRLVLLRLGYWCPLTLTESRRIRSLTRKGSCRGVTQILMASRRRLDRRRDKRSSQMHRRGRNQSDTNKITETKIKANVVQQLTRRIRAFRIKSNIMLVTCEKILATPLHLLPRPKESQLGLDPSSKQPKQGAESVRLNGKQTQKIQLKATILAAQGQPLHVWPIPSSNSSPRAPRNHHVKLHHLIHQPYKRSLPR